MCFSLGYFRVLVIVTVNGMGPNGTISNCSFHNIHEARQKIHEKHIEIFQSFHLIANII